MITTEEQTFIDANLGRYVDAIGKFWNCEKIGEDSYHRWWDNNPEGSICTAEKLLFDIKNVTNSNKAFKLISLNTHKIKSANQLLEWLRS